MTWNEFKKSVNRWNVILHRDIGYVSVGLTLVFAISGIAVNHIEDWNPNYKVEKVSAQIEPVPEGTEEAMVQHVLRQMQLSGPIRSSFQPSPDRLQIFLEDGNLDVQLSTGRLIHEHTAERFLIRDFNFLHLNQPKQVWTWISDLYAMALAFLAISGLFILKGKHGLKGRGAWLSLIGILIPILALLLLK